TEPITEPNTKLNAQPDTEPNTEPKIAMRKKKTKRQGPRFLASQPPTTGPNTEPKIVMPKKKTKRHGPRFFTCRRPITATKTEPPMSWKQIMEVRHPKPIQYQPLQDTVSNRLQHMSKLAVLDAKPSRKTIYFNHVCKKSPLSPTPPLRTDFELTTFQEKGTLVSTYNPISQLRSVKEHEAMRRECYHYAADIEKIRQLVTSRREILDATLTQGTREVSEMKKVFRDNVDGAVGKVVKRCDGL
ncbi:MAG: hypothetical protein L6R37_008424, partial [Teloschistes peruensis]